MTSLVLNFDKVKDIVTQNQNQKVSISHLQFKRSKSWQVTSEILEKLYAFCYTKRALKDDWSTEPFGYVI